MYDYLKEHDPGDAGALLVTILTRCEAGEDFRLHEEFAFVANDEPALSRFVAEIKTRDERDSVINALHLFDDYETEEQMDAWERLENTVKSLDFDH